MNAKEQEQLYRELMGEQAYGRQLIAADQLFSCCGVRRRDGHHPDCPAHPAKRAEKAYRKTHGDQLP